MISGRSGADVSRLLEPVNSKDLLLKVNSNCLKALLILRTTRPPPSPLAEAASLEVRNSQDVFLVGAPSVQR